MSTPAIPILKAAMARAAEVRPKAGGFPYLAEALRQAGVTRCAMTVPSNAMLYSPKPVPWPSRASPCSPACPTYRPSTARP